MVDEVRGRREMFATQAVMQADEFAAHPLGVEDEQDASCEMPALPKASAARATQPGGADHGDLMEWVHEQRQDETPWSEVAEGASQNGFQAGEDAMRTRYRRWRKKNGMAEETEQAG